MIFEILPTGEPNAISGKSICGLLGIDMRTLTVIVEHERKTGAPICATSAKDAPGYYLAANQNEMQRYCRRLSHRINEMTGTLRACTESISRLPEGNDNV